MVRIQPPIDVTRIVSAGRIECRTASPTNAQVQPTLSVILYPPLCGSQPSLIANSQIASIASQKYGNADGMTKFAVTAAHSVTTKNPSRRTTNLKTRASCPHSLSQPVTPWASDGGAGRPSPVPRTQL